MTKEILEEFRILFRRILIFLNLKPKSCTGFCIVFLHWLALKIDRNMSMKFTV